MNETDYYCGYDFYTDRNPCDQMRILKRRKLRCAAWISVAVFLIFTAVGGICSLLLHHRQDVSPKGSAAAGSLLDSMALTRVSYPHMTPYPQSLLAHTDAELAKLNKQREAWRADIEKQRRPEGYADCLDGFFTRSIPVFLSGAEGENRICSPLNIYMALSVLTQITDGQSRQEILNALGINNLDQLRRQASDVWNAQYYDDKVTSMILANSLWLDQSMSFRQETLNTLASDFYVSSFAGKPGSAKMDLALKQWLSQQTGGLLDDSIKGISLNPETVLALFSTVHYRAKWEDVFRAGSTETGLFYGPYGVETCPFMHSSQQSSFYWAKHFSAVSLSMANHGGTMWLLLPDEGITPEELLHQEETLQFLNAGTSWPDCKSLLVRLSLPKFDVSSQIDMVNKLQDLGIQRIFHPGQADFSPLMKDGNTTPASMYLSTCNHSVRVTADEKGVTAAAFVELSAELGCLPPTDSVNFVLNRPFLFAITSDDGLPLFTGIVNHPQ